MPPNYYADPQVHLIAARQSDGIVQSVAGLSKGRYLSDCGCSSARHTRLFPFDSCAIQLSSSNPFIPYSRLLWHVRNFPQGETQVSATRCQKLVWPEVSPSHRAVTRFCLSLRFLANKLVRSSHEWRPRDLEEIPLNSYKSIRCFVITRHRSYREIVQSRWLSRDLWHD